MKGSTAVVAGQEFVPVSFSEPGAATGEPAATFFYSEVTFPQVLSWPGQQGGQIGPALNTQTSARLAELEQGQQRLRGNKGSFYLLPQPEASAPLGKGLLWMEGGRHGLPEHIHAPSTCWGHPHLSSDLLSHSCLSSMEGPC